MKRGRLKMGFWFQTTSFIQPTQAWSHSSSEGFAHEMNKNTATLRMNIRQVSRAKPTLLVAATATCPFPVRRGRLGWGWLRGLRGNQIRAARRATLSPALSRWMGEGAGCMWWHRFLSSYRHSHPCLREDRLRRKSTFESRQLFFQTSVS